MNSFSSAEIGLYRKMNKAKAKAKVIEIAMSSHKAGRKECRIDRFQATLHSREIGTNSVGSYHDWMALFKLFRKRENVWKNTRTLGCFKNNFSCKAGKRRPGGPMLHNGKSHVLIGGEVEILQSA